MTTEKKKTKPTGREKYNPDEILRKAREDHATRISKLESVVTDLDTKVGQLDAHLGFDRLGETEQKAVTALGRTVALVERVEKLEKAIAENYEEHGDISAEASADVNAATREAFDKVLETKVGEALRRQLTDAMVEASAGTVEQIKGQIRDLCRDIARDELAEHDRAQQQQQAPRSKHRRAVSPAVKP